MSPESYLYRAAHPRTAYPVLRVIRRTRRSLHLEIATPKGPIRAWISRKHMAYYVYQRDGQVVREAWIEDWLARKIGIIAEG